MAASHGFDVRHRQYVSGGFTGEFGGTFATISRGKVAVCDLRQGLNVQAMASDTIGLSIPRSLLAGLDVARSVRRLDRHRERLLAARLALFYRRLPQTTVAEVPAVTADLIGFLLRLFDGSPARDVLDGSELDSGLFALAEDAIARDLASPTLSPDRIADHVHTSRATLYRAFAPAGGVMRHVWDLRLGAVRAALEDPLETRPLTRLALDHGFKTVAHMSSSFRNRFGASPREWRERQADRARDHGRRDAPGGLMHNWWTRLGR